jgi:hypothetical protein
MNKILLLLLLPFLAMAQHNFNANNNRVEWSQVFSDSITIIKMETQIRAKLINIEEIAITKNSISGTTDFIPLISNFEDLAPAFRQPVKFNYRMEFKEDRYRVFINNIVFKGIIITLYGVTDNDHFYADTELIRNRDGELRKNKQAKRAFKRLHNAFISTFTYTAPEKW